MRKKLTAVTLSLVLAGPASLFAAGAGETPIQRSAARAVAREVTGMAQAGIGGNGGNPMLIPGLVLIGAGIVVGTMSATFPQWKTQTDDYDVCATANAAATGPSTRTPLCDDFTETNKGLMWVGIGSAAAGTALLTVGALKNYTMRVVPGHGVVVTRTTRF